MKFGCAGRRSLSIGLFLFNFVQCKTIFLPLLGIPGSLKFIFSGNIVLPCLPIDSYAASVLSQKNCNFLVYMSI